MNEQQYINDMIKKANGLKRNMEQCKDMVKAEDVKAFIAVDIKEVDELIGYLSFITGDIVQDFQAFQDVMNKHYQGYVSDWERRKVDL